MTSEPKNGWIVVSIVLTALLLAQLGAFSYVIIESKQTVAELQSGQESLLSEINSLQSQLDRLQGSPSVPSAGLTPVEIYESASSSVVLITAKVQTRTGLEPFASGSGFVYDREGHIVTNHHVVEDADALDVTFIDGTTVAAEIVGDDPYSDIAVIRVDGPLESVSPLPLGNSSELLVGESVAAIGNPYGLSNSMSLGIVSQVDRDLDAPGNYKIIDVVQVDAAINPGNSGGPLMNMRGEVVGVNTAIIQGSVGVGFAIPSDTVRREAPQLIQTGQYEHPWMGISSVDIDPAVAEAAGLNVTKGTLVVSVVPGSPAEAAGIRAGTQGDVIVGVDGIPVRKLIDVLVYIERTKKPGDTVTFTIIREGEALDVEVTLGVRPQQ
jgi:S1-C subfamily serine protease